MNVNPDANSEQKVVGDVVHGADEERDDGGSPEMVP